MAPVVEMEYMGNKKKDQHVSVITGMEDLKAEEEALMVVMDIQDTGETPTCNILIALEGPYYS